MQKSSTGDNNCRQMVRDISVKVHEPPSKARSQKLRSNGTEMVRYIWFLFKFYVVLVLQTSTLHKLKALALLSPFKKW